MVDYARPPLAVEEYTDAAGRAIAYGSRWPGSPPEDAYSVVTHPERFRPVQTVARALIEHLAATYAVTVSSGAECVADFEHASDVLDATRVTPVDPRAASITFGFTRLPGVFLRAGALLEIPLPHCGCDACDDATVDVVGELEQAVFAVAGGGLDEHGVGAALAFELTMADGGSTSGTYDVAPERFAAARGLLAEAGSPWLAWTRR